MNAEEEDIALTREYEQALVRYRKKVKQLEALLFQLMRDEETELEIEEIQEALQGCQVWKDFLDSEIKSSQTQRREYIAKS